MSTMIGSYLGESQFTNRPLMFNGINYNYWKNQMRIDIQFVDYERWMVIVNGPRMPTKTIERVEIPKYENE